MTNQASEDEQIEHITDLLTGYLAGDQFKLDDGWIVGVKPELMSDLLALIRTEKLKLLAEVRERVIGEDYDIPAEMEKVGRDFQKLDAIAKTGGLLNKFKADLRAELTKLEAEL